MGSNGISLQQSHSEMRNKMIFETHAHYDDEMFDKDRDELIASLPGQGICPVINIGASLSSCERTLELMQRYPFFYGAIGVHPSDVDELDEEKFARLEAWCQKKRVVAVGEIGLDYHYEDTDKPCQKKWFAAQLELARRLSLPIVVHSRDAAKDTLDLMKEHRAHEIGGVVHCFSYSLPIAREFYDMGFYFGIGGVLTFSNGKKLREVVDYLPMDRILLETDSPYLAPVPHRGERNCSLYLPLVVEEIARIKGLTTQSVVDITYENACRLFNVEPGCAAGAAK